MFGLYDIRGVYKKDFNEKDIQKIGNILSEILGNAITVGRDTRIHSKEIEEYLIKGLRKKSIVIKAGIVTLPILVFWSIKRNVPSIMITASHNPKEYNGLKIVKEDGTYFSPEDIKKLKEIFEKRDIIEEGNNPVYEMDTRKIYFDTIISKFKEYDFPVCFDFSNGSGFILKELISEIFKRAVFINDYPDGNFPNHNPDPSKEENLKQLKEICIKEKIKYGFCFDGDVDRIGIVYNGKKLDQEFITYLFALAFCKNKDTVILDIAQSYILDSLLNNLGIKVIRSRVGRVFLRPIAKKTKARFFSEYSGHIGFKNFYYIDDGFYSSLMFLKAIEKVNIEEAEKEFPKIYKEYFEYRCIDKERKMEEIKKKAKNIFENIIEIDGIDVRLKQGRILIRKSNTEPLLRIYVEAENKEKLKEYIDLAKKLL